MSKNSQQTTEKLTKSIKKLLSKPVSVLSDKENSVLEKLELIENTHSPILAQLLIDAGVGMLRVHFDRLHNGNILRLHTKSGNIYLLEISDSAKSLAHVYRVNPGKHNARTGYLGNRHVSPSPLRLSDQLYHEHSCTSPIKKIFLLGID